MFTPVWVNPAFKLPTEPFYQRPILCFAFLADAKGRAFGNPHPIWESFFEKAKADGLPFKIIIHTKKETSDYWRQYKHPAPVETSWERTINAHRLLIEFANENECDKTIFLSETCIPVQSPIKVWDALSRTDKTILSGVHKQDAAGIFKHFNYPLSLFKANDWFKAEQWGIIDKQHYKLYFETKIAELFKGSKADNEAYLIALLRTANESKNVLAYSKNGKQAAHFAMWLENQAHPFYFLTKEDIQKHKNERTYDNGSMREFDQRRFDEFISNGCLFFRKFEHNVTPSIDL